MKGIEESFLDSSDPLQTQQLQLLRARLQRKKIEVAKLCWRARTQAQPTLSPSKLPLYKSDRHSQLSIGSHASSEKVEKQEKTPLLNKRVGVVRDKQQEK